MTPDEIGAVLGSVRTAGLATLVLTPFAVAAGLGLARLTGRARVILEAAAMAPLVLPPVVTGFALLWALSPEGPVGGWLASWGIRIAFAPAGAVLAAAVMAFPLYVRAVTSQREVLDDGLPEAARTLGASAARAWGTVTLPLLLPGIATGGLLAFARALGEFGATIVLAGSFGGNQTLPLAVWGALQHPDGDAAAMRLSIAALALSGAALMASEALTRVRAPWLRWPGGRPGAPPAPRGDLASVTLAVQARRGDFALAVNVVLDGGVTGIAGANGAGKTTLLHLIAGLIPARGRIEVGAVVFQDGGRVLAPEARRVGLVFQDLRLFPHLDVAANLAYGARGSIDEVVDLLDLDPLLDRRPQALSGGQRQRVALGRALVTRPRLLLLDEPLAAVDPAARREVVAWLRRALRRSGIPALVVSHTPNDLLQLTDALLVMDAGRVVGIGAPQALWGDPATLPVMHRLGVDNVFPVDVTTVDRDVAHAQIHGRAVILPRPPVPEADRVALRPADVILALDPGRTSARNALSGVVRTVVPVAEDGPRLVHLDVGFPLAAEVTGASVDALGLIPGRGVTALVKTSAFRWL